MRIDSIYNFFPREVSTIDKTELLHGLPTGFAGWYMYVYMYYWLIGRYTVNFWLYVFGEKMTLSWKSFHWFFSASIWKWHAIFMYYVYGIE